jgi:CheY-like chemotaxis protein
VAILDVAMPKLDDLGLAKQISTEPGSRPVLIALICSANNKNY